MEYSNYFSRAPNDYSTNIHKMYLHETKIRIRYGETDQMGYVYYGNYAQFFEIGRVEMLRSLGISYKSMEDEGIMLPVLNFSVKYVKPARYDDLITVKTILRSLPTARIHFDYEIFNASGDLLTTAETTLVFVRKENMRPTSAPKMLLENLHAYFKDESVG